MRMGHFSFMLVFLGAIIFIGQSSFVFAAKEEKTTYRYDDNYKNTYDKKAQHHDLKYKRPEKRETYKYKMDPGSVDKEKKSYRHEDSYTKTQRGDFKYTDPYSKRAQKKREKKEEQAKSEKKKDGEKIEEKPEVAESVKEVKTVVDEQEQEVAIDNNNYRFEDFQFEILEKRDDTR